MDGGDNVFGGVPAQMHVGIHTLALVHAGNHHLARCMLGYTPRGQTNMS